MTKQKSRLWFLSVAAVLLVACSYCLLRFAFLPPRENNTDVTTEASSEPSKPTEPPSPWKTLGENVYYFDPATGNMHTGWLKLGETHYYFHDDGTMATGWHTLNGARYLFDAEGNMITGWYKEGADSYFLRADGTMHAGWLDFEGKRYFFGEDGLMQTGWLKWDTDRYYLHDDGHMAKGEVDIDGTSNFFTSTGKYVVMVNPWHAIPKDYKPDLVKIDGYKFDRSGRDALQQMIDDCCKAGHDCYINNTYRTQGDQQYLWDRGIKKRMNKGMTYEEALTATSQAVAVPGHSEHQIGLAVDIVGTDEMYEWLGEHCWDYGFILRYPADRIPITGIKYEPWHFRYVGIELATELKTLGLCMEEYIAMLTEAEKK